MNAAFSMSSGGVTISGRDQMAFLADRAAADAADPAVADTSAELLRTIAEVLDIRSVFPRISEIVKEMLPHDALDLMFHDRGGRVTLEARSNDDLAGHCAWSDGDEEFYIVSDLQKARSRHAGADSSGFLAHLLEAGYRSMLDVRSVARSQVMRLGFFSKHPGAYGPGTYHGAAHRGLCGGCRGARTAGGGRTGPRGSARPDRAVRCARARRHRQERHDAGRRSRDRTIRGLAAGAGEGVAARHGIHGLPRGESGTGKEVVARFIHHASPTSDRSSPSIARPCRSICSNRALRDERGAFTGAHQAKAGQIELAARGVLFLDEVSEMSPTAQAKFLRFLQEREFTRARRHARPESERARRGGEQSEPAEAVARGTFREDLFYRLQVFDIQLPPLRERISDVPLIAEQFLEELGQTMGRQPARLGEDARERCSATAGRVMSVSCAMCSSAPRS